MSHHGRLRWRFRAVAITILVSTVGPSLSAQSAFPTVTTISTGAPVMPVSAAEAEHHVWIKQSRIENEQSWRAIRYPLDSMRQVVADASVHWLSQLQKNTVTGIQLEPSGRVAVFANQDAYAKQQIAARLATPGLSLSDRASTYLTAIQAFSDPYSPARLPDAEAYLAQLDALGDGAAYWRYQARRRLVHTYYTLGQSDRIIQHGLEAVALTKLVPFYDRRWMFGYDGHTYTATVEALAGRPEGKATIEAMNAALQAATVPPPELVALDSGFVRLGRMYAGSLTQMIQTNSRLGTQALPLVAHYWINRPSHDSATLAVDDGKIRVIDVSDYNCVACLQAQQGLQRLHVLFRSIEVVVVTSTVGYWGNRLVSADDEAVALDEYFRNYQKVTFPVGVWKRPKARNVDGGMTPVSHGPAFDQYPHAVRPTFWIVDGHGIIRRIVQSYNREVETQLQRTVTFLLQEANASSQQSRNVSSSTH